MKIDFRIDFGYQYLYSRKHYHPTYIWDGNLECENGEILNTYKLEYPYTWFGPGHSAKETKLSSPLWEIRTKRELKGIRIEAEVSEDTVFYLNTKTIDLKFSAKEISEKGRLEFLAGPKYLNCYVIITKTDYLWFRQPLKENETEFKAEDLKLPVHDWSRMKLAWLDPKESVKIEYEVKETSRDYMETLIHLVAMAAPKFSPEKEVQVRGYIPFEILCDGKKVCEFERYFRHHDECMQILEDEWRRVKVEPGKHIFEIKNNHDELCVAISRITFKPCEYNHSQLSVPNWAIKGERVLGKVFACFEDKILIEGIGETVDCKEGWNEFSFAFKEAGEKVISTEKDKANIEVFDCEEEKYPVKVGYDLTTVPHDNSGYMDWLLDYTYRTRLGNYIVFRNFNVPAEPGEYTRYGAFCREHSLNVSACMEYLDGELIKAAGESFNECGSHEYTGPVYARNPEESSASKDMKEASEKFIKYNQEKFEQIHEVFPRGAFGDASGGTRYSFLAGASFVRAETMVPHTISLLSKVRPAAEALSDGRWGVHIAIQHPQQPYHETHLGQYFLSLMQAWAMGAETIYEEDSLFNLFKEERQTWDDLLTKGKRDMTRNFYKFAKTHPRKGKNVRNIAFLEGRYAAPFNGFICDTEQDPHYSVWGVYGNNDECWGHKQPEKCRQILDVLSPGASTHPLRQKFDKRRFFFSGTPYGDFDCVPVEASKEYFDNYKLILNLGWNTAICEDMEKLKGFVEDGGVLLTGIPQFSTHVKRDFLKDMKDLALINNGDLSDIAGIKVKGRGKEYSGYWNCKNKKNISEPELSSLPSDFPEEDGKPYLADIELTGAEILAWDYYTGEPMLVKYKLGKGFVYTFTLWAYPGHEAFQRFAAAFVKELSKETLGDVFVKDNSEEVFWTVWENEGKKTVMLLNTDWTQKDNVKKVKIVLKDKETEVLVKERTLVVAETDNDNIILKNYTI